MNRKRKPTIKTRNLLETRKEILQVTFIEVFRNGFQGVSIDDIVKKTNYTKGALFHQFPTKMDLGYALVEEVIQPMITDRWIAPLENYENPIEGIIYQMKTLIGGSKAENLRLGCPLNNLVQEMSTVDAGFKKRLTAALNYWIDATKVHLDRGVKNGTLKSDISTKELAHFVVMSHEGLFGMLKGLDDASAFKILFKSIEKHLISFVQ